MISKNVDNYSLRGFKGLYTCTFIINIFIQVIYNSTWKQSSFSSLGNILSHLSLIPMLLLLLIRMMSSESTLKRWIYVGISALMSLIFIKSGNLSLALIFLFSAYIYFMNFKEIIFSYFIGTLLGVVTIVPLSLMKMLPLYDSTKGLLSFGFINPNTIGFYVIILPMELLILFWNDNRYWVKIAIWINYIVAVLVDEISFKDTTAIILAVAFILLYGVLKFRTAPPKFFIPLSLVISPIILMILSYYLAKTYGTTSNSIFINALLSYRVGIWNFYLTNFPPHLFLQNIDTSSFITVLGQGAFDSAYMSSLISNGILLTVFFVFTLSRVIFVSFKYNKMELSILATIFTILSFTEGVSLTAYQSPIIVLAVAFVDRKWFEQDMEELKN